MKDVIVWSGWAGGAAVGLYLLAQFWLTGKALGVSTAYGNVCGLVLRAPFYRRGKFAQLDDWRLWFMLGLPLGGAIAALTSGASLAPSLDMGAAYERVMPAATWARGLVLVLGGMLIGYGARLAGGCTSGHSIAGLSMRNPPSLIASLGFFAGGLVAVQLLFRIAG